MRPDAATEAFGTGRVPRATYRFQFNRNFTLAHACALVPYLHDLGISHIYASPLLRAVPGSMHGYDICDFHELNPELGTPDDFARLHEELARHQMGLVLDVVPNHMGIDVQDNHWWRDVLTHGRDSQYAGFFDIDWHSTDPRLRGKVAMPILMERYHEALAHGNIRLTETDGVVCLQYAGKSLPVSPESVSALLRRAAESVPSGGAAAILEAMADINNAPEEMDKFIQMQNYVLMFWGNGDESLNYRRFFTISSLAGIKIEEEPVFTGAFALVKQWLDKNWVDGLRVDHVDGLRYPEKFLRRLRRLAPAAWIVVEKILGPRESLDPNWPVDGTTGYEFLNNLNGVFIDPQGEKPLSDFYRTFTGDSVDYATAARVKKLTIIRDHFAAEAGRLTDLLVRISVRRWECRDFTRSELADAWIELAASFPIYRTYAGASDHREVSKSDARIIYGAGAAARASRPDLPGELFDFLQNLFLLRRPGGLEDDFVLRFQQLTGPIMAKAVEDTAFFCYPRFAALNEVGGDPGCFGITLSAFHQFCQRQLNVRPGSLAATATHDTKLGGDVRARLALLSERSQEWIEAVRRWSKINDPKRRGNMPDRKMEYLFYQALVGAWPLEIDRALAYMQKAAREAKEHTGWREPSLEYEAALQSFVKAAMEDSVFMRDVEQFVLPLLDPGWINSLAQTLVKLTAPGVPDIYQGAELWDLTLTDPDNRRPVDFSLRRQMMADAKGLSAEECWRRRESGVPKMWLIRKVLAFRRRCPGVFGAGGAYETAIVSGAKATHVLAFIRSNKAITVAPRLVGTSGNDWRDTTFELPEGCWINVLTNARVTSGLMKELTASFPVALLMREDR